VPPTHGGTTFSLIDTNPTHYRGTLETSVGQEAFEGG